MQDIRPQILAAIIFSVAICAACTGESWAAEGTQPTLVLFDGKPIVPLHGSSNGFWMYAQESVPQLALMAHLEKTPSCIVVALDKGQRATLRIPLPSSKGKTWFSLLAKKLNGSPAAVALSSAASKTSADVGDEKSLVLTFDSDPANPNMLSVDISATHGATVVSLECFDLKQDGRAVAFRISPQRRLYPEKGPVACSPAMHGSIEQALIEWDWQLQDGIGTPRESRSHAQAVEQILARGDLLLADLGDNGVDLGQKPAAWTQLHQRYKKLKKATKIYATAWQSLWLDAHRLRRQIVLSNPLLDTGPLLFAKRVPSTMSHQLTQYYGYTAQPGGGLFVLEQPGRSMRVRRLSGSLPAGSYLRPDVSYDASTIYFAFCPCAAPPSMWRDPKCMNRRYHLYAMDADGQNVRRLTDGPYDDLTPIELPSGKLLFPSTRRGGYHRCGRGPCEVYSLALAEADGSNPHAISFHETNEWDPTVLDNGRVVYTRWDYVDRNAIFYQQLWSVRQDGSDVRIFYGNNTFNPIGTWETRPVPGSNKVMATAAPHHGMSAGSIILLDTSRGVDGMEPITRLTPDALFPEAENALARVPASSVARFDDRFKKAWGPQPQSQPTQPDHAPLEEKRWPGHCYRSPYPLSEKYFLAAYSYDRLRGELATNRPNMFGLYALDAFGNKELLYRDANISSQWPVPLRPRVRPLILEMPSTWADNSKERPQGTFFLRNVHESWPKLPDVKIKRLRIVQVLPKTTPNSNTPRVGAANASPGKQVLGTVPVERDGSAYFRVPARTPVLFQALDTQGRAVQTMRSLTYLQPGEQVSCVGCHESRTHAPEALVASAQAARPALALSRPPSPITPGPDGSKPLSYPILVQPLLDRHCVSCHNAKKPEGKLVLTGEPAGAFSRSYNALIPFVSFSSWGAKDFNHEPLTTPNRFGARASRLVELLDKGHYDVKLSQQDWDRLVTWIDANALFYGTFNPAEQKKQQRGERIAGPDLE